MNPYYSKFLSFDLAFYEIHDDGYDPLKTIENFWKRYSIKTVCDYLVDVETHLANISPNEQQTFAPEELSAFKIELFRTLVAYLIAHYKEIDLSKILPPAILATTKEEVETSKKVYDFFKSTSQVDTNN